MSRARTFALGVVGSPATRRGAQSIQVPDRSVTGLFHAQPPAYAQPPASAHEAREAREAYEAHDDHPGQTAGSHA